MAQQRKNAGDMAARETERAHRAVDETQAAHSPRKGETYRCESCGMEVEVLVGCDCGGKESEAAHFQCCGQELTRV